MPFWFFHISKATSSGRSLSVRVDIDVVVASASNYVAAIKGIGDAITARIILYLKINDQS
jgi:hypothetical protein